MKKLVVLGLVVAGFAMTSCKKDYTCECTFTSIPTINIEYTKVKKADAETSCDAAETTYKVGDSGANCTLK